MSGISRLVGINWKLGISLDGPTLCKRDAELAQLAEQQVPHTSGSPEVQDQGSLSQTGLSGHRTKRIQLGPVAISPFEMHPVRIGAFPPHPKRDGWWRASIVSEVEAI